MFFSRTQLGILVWQRRESSKEMEVFFFAAINNRPCRRHMNVRARFFLMVVIADIRPTPKYSSVWAVPPAVYKVKKISGQRTWESKLDMQTLQVYGTALFFFGSKDKSPFIVKE
jgi:hypothetical protein